jgi:hypothetical protein
MHSLVRQNSLEFSNQNIYKITSLKIVTLHTRNSGNLRCLYITGCLPYERIQIQRLFAWASLT